MAGPARVLEEALALAPTDRARIARELIASLEPADEEIEASWADEVRRRIDEIEAGEAELEDWTAVRRKLCESVRR